MHLDRETPVGIVGAGRLGGSLARAMHANGYALRMISRRDAASARALARALPGVVGTDDDQAVVDGTEVVVLAAADAHIERLAATLRFRPGQAVVHCSGATPVSALNEARARGTMTGGLHPLQTFPTDDAADRFGGVTFGIESTDAPLHAWLGALTEALGGTPLVLSDETRATYHAAAFMVSGLLSTWVTSAAALWTRLGVGQPDAVAALTPLMERALSDVRERGVGSGLTGPIVRADVAVVSSHLAALAESGPDTVRAYAALGLVHLAAAREAGVSLPVDRAEQIEDALRATLTELQSAPERAADTP